MASGLLLTYKTNIAMNNQELKDFLEWLTDGTTYNIQKDEIIEIIKDWRFFKLCSSDQNNTPFTIPDVSVNEEVVCDHSGVNVMPRTKWEQTKR